MKSQTKIKNTKKRKVVSKPKKPSVVFVHAKNPILRHFRLVEHKHTGKLIHHRHTSHLTLAGILVLIGFFLYANTGYVRAETTSGSVTVGVIVTGPAPTVGAEITSPKDGDVLTDQNTVDVSGTCAEDTFVVVRDNDSTVGSTVCTSAGVFSLEIQLTIGENVLSALNYDNLNQVGPATSSIKISVRQSEAAIETEIITEVTPPALPVNPSIIPGATPDSFDCSDYHAGEMPTGGEPHIAVVCVPRLFLPTIKQVMGIVVWGGTPPYAVSIDFGAASVEDENSASDSDTLLSIESPGYRTVSFSYAIPNTYKIAFKMKDKDGKTAIVQTAVQANGTTENPITSATDDIFSLSWFQSPVPFYLVAVAITLGFWGGDIFDRRFGTNKGRRQTKKAA